MKRGVAGDCRALFLEGLAMMNMWAAVVMIVMSGRDGTVSYIPFYDVAACEAAKVVASSQLPWGSRALCVPTVTGNAARHNDR